MKLFSILPAGVLKHPSSLSADIVEKTEDKAEARQKKKKHDKSKGLSNGHLDKRATTKIVENQEELQSTIGCSRGIADIESEGEQKQGTFRIHTT